MLNNIKNLKSERGFTIVELLIVIVVIAILAAITIVAYNGIQARAKATSGQNLASQVAKKAEAYNTLNSSYPTYCQLTVNRKDSTLSSGACTAGTAAQAAGDEAKLDSPSSVLQAVPDSTTGNGGQAVSYVTATGGACVGWWDYAATAPGVKYVKVGSASC